MADPGLLGGQFSIIARGHSSVRLDYLVSDFWGQSSHMDILKSQTSGLWGEIQPPRDVFDFETKKKKKKTRVASY